MKKTAPEKLQFKPKTGLLSFLLLMVFTLSLTTAGIYQVWRQYQVISVAYAIDQERFEHQRLTERSKRLGLSLATYKSPSSVRTFAEETLGMRVPGTRDEFHVPGDEEVQAKPMPSSPQALGESAEHAPAEASKEADAP